MSKIGQVALELEDLDGDIDAAVKAINDRDVIIVSSPEETDITAAKEDKEEKSSKPAKATKTATKEDVKAINADSDFQAFKRYVNGNKLAIQGQDGKVFLKAEAWLYLAKLKGVIPSCSTTERYDRNDNLVSVKAECSLIRESDGVTISRSSMIASKDEDFLTKLDDFAVYGMAQTRAITRAIRDVYGYVARGAGFEATPAIELGLEGVKE